LSNLGKVFSKVFRKKEKPQEKVPEEEISLHSKIYLKALPIRNISDVDTVKEEVKAGNILILRVEPLARKSIDDVKRVVNELCDFAQSIGGDIARLGEERIVITPSTIRIWREKTVVPTEKVSTAA